MGLGTGSPSRAEPGGSDPARVFHMARRAGSQHLDRDGQGKFRCSKPWLGNSEGFLRSFSSSQKPGGFAAPAFQGIHKTKCWDPIEPSNIQWHFPRRRRRSRAKPQGPGRAPAEIILFCQAPFPPAAPIGHGAWRFFLGDAFLALFPADQTLPIK